MPGQKPSAHDFVGWLVGRWRALLIMILLAPVLGPGIAIFCLAAGVPTVVRSRSSKVAQQVSLGETLNALIAAGLPTVVYGCTVWGWQVLFPASGWTGWITVWLVAGLVTLVAGLLPAIYIVGYSWGVAQGEAAQSLPFRSPSPPVSLSEQMLGPFRRRRP